MIKYELLESIKYLSYLLQWALKEQNKREILVFTL